MMKVPVPYSLLPKPKSVRLMEGDFSFAGPLRLRIPEAWSFHREWLIHAFSLFGMELLPSDSPESAAIAVRKNPRWKEEAFEITVTPERIELTAGGNAGGLYGMEAISQLAAVAAITGAENPRCECCVIRDEPEFRWRGIMLDCVRHFLSRELIFRVIRMMAAWRLRVLHLHLTDSQGWRIRMPWMERCSREEMRGKEMYSEEDLLAIAELASEYGIEIVPEIDMPGHQHGFLKCCPEYSCSPDRLRGELCISSPEVKRFAAESLQEVVRQVPSCRYIHLGGDETETENWETCSSCRSVMMKQALTVRELERQFMTEMCGIVRSLGRIPICWCSDALPPEGSVMQAWRISWPDITNAQKARCQIINSISQNFYFDFPVNATDPHAAAMPILNEESVYNSSPYFFLNKESAGKDFLGIEACLWTECVPEWRVLRKLEPRIQALAECAWTPAAQRSWEEFLARRTRLDHSGWSHFANSGILLNPREKLR